MSQDPKLLQEKFNKRHLESLLDLIKEFKAHRVQCARCNSSVDSNCAYELPNQPIANRYCWICYNTLMHSYSPELEGY